MSRDLSSDFVKQLKTLINTGSWKLFIELQLNDTESVYVTNNEESTTFDSDVYDPFRN